MTMTVVHAAETGHVVGALSGVGSPAALDLTALVGAALVLHLRTGDNTTKDLPLPSELLKVATVPEDDRVFGDTSSYAVVKDATGAQVLQLLNGWGADPVGLTETGVKVTLPQAVSADTPLLVVVSDGGKPLLGRVAANTDNVELPATLDKGDHAVLLLVAGRRALLVVESVT